MTPRDTVAFVLIPKGALWEAFSNPRVGDAERPLFSLSEANQNSAHGRHQFADTDGRGTVVGIEYTRHDGTGKMVRNDSWENWS